MDNIKFDTFNENDEYDGESGDLENEDVEEEAEIEEPYKLSTFRRAFPYRKYKDGYPSAVVQAAHMKERRPLWLPKFGLDVSYFKHASYFSEIVSREQYSRQLLIDLLYKPNLGEYKFSKTTLIRKRYISEYLQGVNTLKFSPNGKYLVVGCGNGSIEVFHTKNKESEQLFLKGLPRKITTIRFHTSRSTRFFASSLSGRIYMGVKSKGKWNCYSYIKEYKNEINAMDTSFSGYHLASAGKDANIRIYDVHRTKLLKVFPSPGSGVGILTSELHEEGHYRRVCALKYDPLNRHLLLTGGWDNIIKIWDDRTGDVPVRSIFGPHISGDALDVMGKIVLSGQWTCTDSLQLWDMSTGKLITNVSPQNRSICYSGEFINSTRFLHTPETSSVINSPTSGDLVIACGSGTRALEVISIKENSVLHSSQEANAVMTLDHYNNLIAYGSVNHLYAILKFSPYEGKLQLSAALADEPTQAKEEADTVKVGYCPAGIMDTGLLEIIEGYRTNKEAAVKGERMPTKEEHFLKELIKEIKEYEGTGPKSLLGEKLRRYIAQVANFTDAPKPENEQRVEAQSNMPTYTMPKSFDNKYLI